MTEPNTVYSHPGEFIKAEIEQRNWSFYQFVNKTGLDYDHASAIIDGRSPITNHNAWRIANAFGTSAKLWLNLQRAYDVLEESKNDREAEVK